MIVFPFLILIRILFAASMVFIIGYIFGGFSRKRTLATISKVAAILVIVLFIGMNVLLMWTAFHRDGHGGWRGGCEQQVKTEKQG
ncbi:hypothetical protein [Chitinophaga qingshengii]|uniref:DUF2909 family protein n=1 Tax=Chitinophaga qingshengii TaxID=1569794 RepID=A0ABR7TKD5_9BACT|nr:hypothetical protein [Chitinophaga qingshengii]MBC9930919.1 hypothetical protein [Chitinophaga qingshengii]